MLIPTMRIFRLTGLSSPLPLVLSELHIQGSNGINGVRDDEDGKRTRRLWRL
jgi:hypothetical protein